jgi:hypothetical protein
VPVSISFYRSWGSTVLIVLLVLVLLSLAALLLIKSNREPENIGAVPGGSQALVVYEQGAVVSFGEEATFRFVAGEGYWEDTLQFLRLDSLHQSGLTDTLVAA